MVRGMAQSDGLEPAGELERSEGVCASPGSLTKADQRWSWWPLLPLKSVYLQWI